MYPLSELSRLANSCSLTPFLKWQEGIIQTDALRLSVAVGDIIKVEPPRDPCSLHIRVLKRLIRSPTQDLLPSLSPLQVYLWLTVHQRAILNSLRPIGMILGAGYSGMHRAVMLLNPEPKR